MRKGFLLAIAIVAAVIASGDAQTFYSGPIIFRFASDNANGVPNSWIVADGQITSETPKAFRQFLASNNIKRGVSRVSGVRAAGLEVYLNSPGGNLFGGVELGEVIREFGLGTRVARSIPVNDRVHSETDELGGCYSACAFAFLGGRWRAAPDRALGVHQHFIENALTEPNAKKFTAADFSDVQMVEGLLADYVLRMGVDARFLVRAATTSPNKIYTFTSDEMKQFGITWNELEYTDWRLEASQNGLIAQSKTRNGEHFATLFCSKDGTVRLLISSPINQSDEAYLRPFLRGKEKEKAIFLPNLFGEEIPAKNISDRIEHGRLILEVQIPSSLRASDDNWLPDGKTPAWYVHDIQFPKNMMYMAYDPTSAEWKSLTPEERQRRRRFFESGYRASFGTPPTYAADGNPVVPKDMPDFGGLSVGGDLKYFFAGDIPGTNFLTYSKLVGRNCF